MRRTRGNIRRSCRSSGSRAGQETDLRVGYFYYHLNGSDIANVTVLPAFGTADPQQQCAGPRHVERRLFSRPRTNSSPPCTSRACATPTRGPQRRSATPATAARSAKCLRPIGSAEPAFADYKNHFTNWSYTAGVDWKPADDTLLYLKTSRGFKGRRAEHRRKPSPAATIPSDLRPSPITSLASRPSSLIAPRG